MDRKIDKCFLCKSPFRDNEKPKKFGPYKICNTCFDLLIIALTNRKHRDESEDNK